MRPEVHRVILDLIDSLEYVDRVHPNAVSGVFTRQTRIAEAQKLLADSSVDLHDQTAAHNEKPLTMEAIEDMIGMVASGKEIYPRDTFRALRCLTRLVYRQQARIAESISQLVHVQKLLSDA